MSLFSGMRRGSAPVANDSIARAVITPAMVTMFSDGSIAQGELAQLGNLCSFSPIFGGMKGESVVALIQGIVNDLQKRGANAVMGEAVEALSPALRETALIFAMRIALADGQLAETEKQVLMAMSRHMQIPDEVTDAMFSVVMVMQRPASA